MQLARPSALLTLFLASISMLTPACDSDSSGSAGSTTTSNGGNGGSGATATGTAGSGAGGTATGGTGTGASSTGTTTGTGAVGGFVEVKCVNQTYQCGDAIDNDGDGLTDWTDPDCLGPCDNTEDSYYTNIPGGDGPACTVDCYWDSNSGAGNDECYWSHQCDPNEQTDPGHPEPNSVCPYDLNAQIPGTPLGCDELLQMQSQTCYDVCKPLTPNGCDCFGCCELPAGTGKFVWLGSKDEATGLGSCTQDAINDPTKCEPCIPVPGCYNGCDPCELCIGKDTLPPECNPGGTGGAGGTGTGGTGTGGSIGTQCPPGVQACGLPGQALCPPDFYCITGCCIENVPK
ncbi:MAG: hypothetical protein IPK82_03280 [Polyangiaceae bacterium]|nr:hypothetical protein [Polyangiaceae bacterium]